MARSFEELLDQAEILAKAFENHDPNTVAMRDATSLRELRAAFLGRVAAERALVEAVVAARRDGHSWAAIGAMVGTSGEAARQRYAEATSQP